MDDLFIVLGLILVSPFVLSIWALVAAYRTRRRLVELTEKFRMVDHRVIRLAEAVAAAGPSPAPPPAAAEPAPALPSEPAAAETPPATPQPEEPATPAPPMPDTVSAGPRPSRASGWRWEKALAENWLVWLGGVTLALGGAFLVKLSIDYGLLVPGVRVILAALLGIGLALGADRLARRERREESASPAGSSPAGSSYVAQALAASGAAILFAAIYAAYQLYGLIGPTLAFPLLALTAGAATAMSLRHGPFVAAVGLVGAYAVPALVVTETPQALPLFAYLAFVTAASLALLRHRAWWWLAWLSLVGAMVWPLLWLAEPPANPGFAVVAAYVLAQIVLFAAFRRGIAQIGFLAGIADRPEVRILTRLAFIAAALVMVALVHTAGFDTASLAASFAAAVAMLWFAWRDPALDDVIATSGALLGLVLVSWELPVFVQQTDLSIYARPPAQIAHFLSTAVLAALLLGGGCYALLGRVARPGRWAALSAAAPAVILLIAYWRLHGFALDIGWSGLALVLAALELGGAATVARRRNGAVEIEIALGAYAIGMLGGTILAATFALSNAWLSVALALHLPAMGWVEGKVRAPVIRWAAAAIAGAVIVRLALNPYVLDYPLSPAPIVNWLLYGYGVPALAFIVATRQFGGRADDLLVGLLEAGSILFTAALLTLELRHLLYGSIAAPYTSTGKDATQALLWLSLSTFLLWLGARRRRPVLRWGGVVLFVMASAQTVIWHALIDNPLWSGDAVGHLVVFDALSLAFALPALLYALIAWLRLGPAPLPFTARTLAVALAFLWLNLEIRHVFQGEHLSLARASEAEWYTYSAVWLAFAGIGLAAGLTLRSEWLRRAALIGIGVVVAKVFLSDMAQLSGVLRALSFLGLGGVLIGIGYAYRRFRPVQEPPAG